MLQLQRSWMDRLSEHGVQTEFTGADTVCLRSIPTDSNCFSKPESNLLIKRPREGMPFWMFVDIDLEYRGANGNLGRLFAGGATKQGWRLVRTSGDPTADLRDVIEDGLEMLGSPACSVPSRSKAHDVIREPGPRSGRSGEPEHGRLLSLVGVNLTELTAEETGESVLFRDEEIDEVASIVLQRKPQSCIVEGGPGIGKSALTRGLAVRLRSIRPTWNVASVDLGVLFAGTQFDADRENLLRQLVTEARDVDAVLVLENVDLAFREARHGRFLLVEAAGAGTRVVGLGRTGFAAAVEHDPRFRVLQLAELSRRQTVRILADAWPRIATHNRLELESATDVLDEVVELAASSPGHLPGKAVRLLDLSSSRAAVLGAARLDPVHVYLAGGDR